VIVAPRGFSGDGGARLERIGVGYDGSPESAIALVWAQVLAAQLGTSLRLIGVVPPVRSHGLTGRGHRHAIAEQMEASLLAAVERSKLNIASEVRSGDAADSLA
jgi:nucleotide-binding universal stress UspA family protein